MSCTVCNHPQRQEIDLALLNRSATLAQLSQQHRLSTSALHRHQQHLQQKTAQALNRLQDLLREGYLFKLNQLLEMVYRAGQMADAAGNSRQLLQAVRQATNIMKFMAKLDSSLTPDTAHRLLASPQWADQGSLLPTDPQIIVSSHQALAAFLFAACPEPSQQAEPLAAVPGAETALADLADLNPENLQALLAGLSQSLDSGRGDPHPPKREKGGKKPGKITSRSNNYKEYHEVNKVGKNSGKNPGHPLETRQPHRETPPASPLATRNAKLLTPDWVQDLDAGRLDLTTLNAIGAGRLPDPDLFQTSLPA
jgi:hypothetical protein